MAVDNAIRNHQAWIGYLQPDGLVVSAAALVDAQVFLDQNLLPIQQRFLPFTQVVELNESEVVAVTDFPAFVREFLEWPADYLAGLDPARPLPDDLSVPLPEFNETLTPSFALRDLKPKDATNPWLLLAKVLPFGDDLDAAATGKEAQWSASPSRRFERLLRETKVPIGVLTNGLQIRLIYAPRGENSGSITFPVEAMTEVAGRPILGALHMLLHRYRLYSAPSESRLPALLERSRAYQSRVSEELARQVLDSLYELLRGFQAADERAKGELLREVLASNPNDVYGGLLTVLLRLVFLLYAEDRGLMPASSVFVQNYSIHGLFERLRVDYERYPDTIDQRFGAWSQLLALFRAIFNGCRHPQLKMPARKGFLFDPSRYPFLEGKSDTAAHVPLVSDGVVFRVLRNLLILDGERLSYRTLDVEQIGSVYETMVGFRLEVADGATIALKPAKSKGAPMAINLEKLLAVKPVERMKWLREQADQKLSGEAAEALKNAKALDDVLAALERRIARNATPGIVPKGAMVLQPSDERRRSGSHYTPRSLTEPIVRKTLEPILKRLGDRPTPDQFLDLKVCDIAVGSGAFIVEACRQLGDELVKAWHNHQQQPLIPPDEDEVLHARRLVAQRCLYGVDRNPMAVDLAKLSLWLATLAKEHPFTFLDHSIRCGDSLVGLTRKQLADFHWRSEPTRVFGQDAIEKRIARAAAFRKEILEADELLSPVLKREKLDLADEALDFVRIAGNCVIAAFFAGDTDKARLAKRTQYLERFTEFFEKFDLEKNIKELVDGLQSEPFPIRPFHWEIEFPEVFDRQNGGFDAIVGNPPFAGKNTLLNGNRVGYLDWLKILHEESHGNSDLVAHFFRLAFNILRKDGCFGLIATNTIGQGDTRHTGLRWICTHKGMIYATRKRYKWPGQAAVIVSIVWIVKGTFKGPFDLDGRVVPIITAYLFHAGGHENPVVLKANAAKSFQGPIILGMGFTFDDTDGKAVANSIAMMQRLVNNNPHNQEVIFPYIGGEEVNNTPTHAHHRFVINFGDMPLCRRDFGRSWSRANERERKEWLRSGVVPLDYPESVSSDWPDLLSLVEKNVKPERLAQKDEGGKQKWWLFLRPRPEMQHAIRNLPRVLVINCGATPHMSFTFLSSRMVYANTLAIIAFETDAVFCTLQSRVHEAWSRLTASSMKDDLRYTPTDSFETFPLPIGFEVNQKLEQAGRQYYELRAALMVQNDEGLTKTYNRFHDPEESSPDILRLRELHDKMDRAALDAYGWTDIKPACEFILDYEEDDDEEESRKRKKPWRYRWPDAIRDEVLVRLLELNKQRAAEEALAGESAQDHKSSSKTKGRKKKPAADALQELLFLGDKKEKA